MVANGDVQKEPWSSEAYAKAASFVPQLTTKIVQYLSPQRDDLILDIGSGDGALTAKIAPLCTAITGLDSSESFTETAKTTVTPLHPNTTFFKHDCRRLNNVSALDGSTLQSNVYDKIFSNAALHWILRDDSTRLPFFEDVYRLLKPGGCFVFEMGGAGNVAEIHTALRSVLHLSYGIPMQRLGAINPWFFPSENWMQQTLQNIGFRVELVESEYRPTKLNAETADGSGGLEGWIRLMCASFLDQVEPSQRSEAVRKLVEVLGGVIKREDEAMYLGYVRLRAVALKSTYLNT